MRNLFSTTLFVALFAVLGFAAFMAFPRSGVSDSVAGAAPAAEAGSVEEAASFAPTATVNFTNISIPLDAGITTADDVASYIDSSGSIVQVARWDSANQTLVFRNVGSPFGTPNFSVNVGDWLLVGANSSLPADFSFAWVGDVPAIESRTYDFVANGFSSMMLPLNREDLTTADALANDIGNITQVAQWDATNQTFIFRNVGSPFGTPNFSIQPGYPYLLYSTTAQSWSGPEPSS